MRSDQEKSAQGGNNGGSNNGADQWHELVCPRDAIGDWRPDRCAQYAEGIGASTRFGDLPDVSV